MLNQRKSGENESSFKKSGRFYVFFIVLLQGSGFPYARSYCQLSVPIVKFYPSDCHSVLRSPYEKFELAKTQ